MLRLKEGEKTYKIFTSFFDVSLLLYFCAFVILNNDELDMTGSDSLFRNLATLSLLVSGTILSYFCTNENRVPFSHNTYLKGYILFAVFCVFSILWASYPDYSISIIIALIRIIIIAFFLSRRICSKHDVNVFFLIFILMTLVRCIFVGTLMYAFYADDFITYRFGANFNYNPNETALFCICSVTFIVYYLFSFSQNKIVRVLGILLFLLFVIIIFLSQSRKGLVGLIVAPLLFFHFQGRSVLKYILVISGLALLLLFFVPSDFLVDIIGGSFDRMTSLFGSGKDTSTDLRESYTNLALKMWEQNPLLGIGINNFAPLNTVLKGAYSHNNYVELLAGVGICGFVLYYIPLLFVAIQKSKVSIHHVFKALVIVLIFLEMGNVAYQTFTFQSLYAILSIIVVLSKKAAL